MEADDGMSERVKQLVAELVQKNNLYRVAKACGWLTKRNVPDTTKVARMMNSGRCQLDEWDTLLRVSGKLNVPCETEQNADTCKMQSQG